MVTSRDILNAVSRSFALTIPMLDPNKVDEVENQYLLARLIDTIEDSDLTIDLKKEVMYDFFETLDMEADGPDLSLLSEAAIDEHDRVLLDNFSVVNKTYRGLEEDVKMISSACIYEMGQGMLAFQSRQINTFDELDEYCYYVAGTIGIYLTDLVSLKDDVKLNRSQAVGFGRYLQKTNIIKDVRKDLDEGRQFWPRSMFEADQMNPDLEHLEKMIQSAEKEQKNTFEYIKSIPYEIPGYREFCLVASIMAAETLKLIRDNQAVFHGDVKISREQLGDILSHIKRGHYTNERLEEDYCL